MNKVHPKSFKIEEKNRINKTALKWKSDQLSGHAFDRCEVFFLQNTLAALENFRNKNCRSNFWAMYECSKNNNKSTELTK